MVKKKACDRMMMKPFRKVDSHTLSRQNSDKLNNKNVRQKDIILTATTIITTKVNDSVDSIV